MAQFKRPQRTIFQYLTYDNYYLRLQNNELNKTINALEGNLTELNRFITSQYDLSFNVKEGLKMVTFDGAGVMLGCIQSDASGRFVNCLDLSDGYLPYVMNPSVVDRGPVSRSCDASRCFPYDYPYNYYPYYGNYRYPYYPGIPFDYYRDMDMSGIMMPHHQIIPGTSGTHIHIHPK